MGICEQILDEGQELARGKRFYPKRHIVSPILLLRVGVSAKHEDGEEITCVANRSYEFRTIHSRHQMIGNYHANRGTVIEIEKSQGLGAVKGHRNTVGSAFQDGLSGRSLERIVINQQNVCSHPQSITQTIKYRH
jgi:hypothetical protein